MRIIITLSLLVLVVASAASAERFVPAPEQKPERARSARLPPTAAIAQISTRKPAVEVRQAPVPLAWTFKHQAVALPEGQGPGEQGPTIADLAGRALTEQTGQMADTGEAAAKAAVEADGYKGIRGLVRSADGSWSGRALRGRTEIAIRVSPDGSVSAD